MGDVKTKILLTGASGFIGKNICESFLGEKYDIIAPSSKELNLINDKVVDSFFENNHVDFVIHSACKPGHRNALDPNNIFFANTQMFFNLERNKQHYKKLINIGSGAIYDMRAYKPKMKEEYFSKNIPIDQHGFCKYVCGKYIENTDKIVDLRVFGIFGKYEDYAIRFISNMICKSLFDLPLTMKQNRRFDYLFAEDLMPVLDYLIQNNNKYKAYNITPDKSIELLSIAQKVLEVSGKNLPIVSEQEGMGLEYSGDNKLLKNEMKNIYFTPIEISIKKLYNWYVENFNNINKNCLLTDK
jgi:GDP-L-fucose synthase